MSTQIHQEVVFGTSPEEVYRAFMDETRHSALTGGTSKIDQRIGGLAEMHDGQIIARNIELEPGRRIVQAWRVNGWEEGIYTMLRITLDADGDNTRVTLDQTGCPEEMTDHLAAGWNQRYWQPFAAHFGGAA